MFLKSAFAEHPFRYRVFQGLDHLTHQFSVMVHDITLLSFGYQNNNLLNIKLEKNNRFECIFR